MFVSELECLEKTESLIHISSNRQIINCDLSQLASRINDKETTECETLILLENTISSTDGHVLVSQEWYLHVSQTTLLPASLAPGQVREVAVSGAGYHCTVQGSKLSSSVIESNDLSWADKGEVQWVEEQYNIFTLVVVQADLLELAIDNSSSLELGGTHLWLKSHLTLNISANYKIGLLTA